MSITKTCVLAIVAATAIYVQGTAMAALSTSNIGSLPSPDGQNITSDSLTGLDWLDPAATLGQSFNTVTGLFGTDLVGFSYATRAQVSTFFSHMPDPLPTHPTYNFNAVNDAGAAWVSSTAYFGSTYVDATSGYTIAVTADPGPFSASHHFYYVRVDLPLSPGSYTVTDGDQYYADHNGDIALGSWLIRATPLAAADVPEPASIVVWGVLACCGVASARLRRRTTDRRGR